MSRKFFSHPNRPFIKHIKNMIDKDDSNIIKNVKLFHDIGKLKEAFQLYIRDTSKNIKNKEHSFLSAYFYLLNTAEVELESLFGFWSIVSHHGDASNFFDLLDGDYLEKNCFQRSEFAFWDEVACNCQKIDEYKNILTNKQELVQKTSSLKLYLLGRKLQTKFDYEDFIDFKNIYSSLIYSDKFEAIFNQKKQEANKIDKNIVEDYIKKFEFNAKRDEFKNYVLNNFDKNHKLFTLTAPTGYGKTLTALNFALQFEKERVIFALPFTSIIDQTHEIVEDIFKDDTTSVSKIHHKTTIDENVDEDRYSKLKFLLNSFSSDINITTLYQIIFAIFGNKNRDNVKFNQLKNSVIIIDEAQALPYAFRKDFMKLCEIISCKFNTVFIFMSATMPVVNKKTYKEVSNLDYFKKQNRYVLKWIDDDETSLIEKIKKEAKTKNTLVVVNTIQKVQELFLKFQNDFECYCLDGYMTDIHKQETIKQVANKINSNEKILLVSTQSIEAGVDLDFEVGFREVSPISSIIQTAGRVNRHFGKNQGVLYIFNDISGYSDRIYGDLQIISKNISQTLKQKDINECEILTLSQVYFKKINDQLERYLLEDKMSKLAFANIHETIKKIMDSNYKEILIIEPEKDFIKEIEEQILQINQTIDNKFHKRDLKQSVIKKLIQHAINISPKDKPSKSMPEVKYLKNLQYLPFGAEGYSKDMGFIKKDILPNRDIFSV